MSKEWRSIKDYPSYEVSCDGCVRSWRRRNRNSRVPTEPRSLKGTVNRSGHVVVNLYEGGSYKTAYVHRLVLEAFVGQCPPDMEACHNDGVATNNHVDNLRWDTRQSNVQDMIRHGVYNGCARVVV